ncbi:hypothetical protein CANTEDRAFT_116011 [Yamadazyma tenuis ATCC 10573]|uniref:Zn(2)-C6 fungal-type domain-containing protein n=1 Tax=Candida tenuis (strain ATCC 10573 / BCRC 21748 / CBS 615 / JCM 9827 / NBRC 10315 / NRRL Y-1498 / VKM Y-70) TaxID=590646 RepID=G3BF13_CANTC|nr:uncharacterized protein CANTEDRAFT_116011 [Yamadazyma tenuis ATCC 10573]EGV59984.1 hypothetical protein CANTEDRAFT_116011 [Yamadazyma tenuis ATCC 10573]
MAKSKNYELSQLYSSRPYKSRYQRPCDLCRKRKTCCIMSTQSTCLSCIKSNNGNCTFNEGPVQRRNRKVPAVTLPTQQIPRQLPASFDNHSPKVRPELGSIGSGGSNGSSGSNGSRGSSGSSGSIGSGSISIDSGSISIGSGSISIGNGESGGSTDARVPAIGSFTTNLISPTTVTTFTTVITAVDTQSTYPLSEFTLEDGSLLPAEQVQEPDILDLDYISPTFSSFAQIEFEDMLSYY